MNKKKQYYYDYNQTVPDNSPPTPTPTPQQSQTPTPPPAQTTTPAQDVNTQSPPPPEIGDHTQDADVKKSNFLPIILVIIALLVIGLIIWALVPKDYQACLKFPGSKTTQIEPPTCQTFYGSSFTPSSDEKLVEETTNSENAQDAPDSDTDSDTDQANDNSDTTGTNNQANGPIPTPTDQNGNIAGSTSNNTGSNTNTNNNPNQSDQNTQTTTKGGNPVTPAPTKAPQPTPKPTSTPPQNIDGSGDSQTHNPPIDWTKHSYPTQKFVIYMPKNYSPGSAVRNINTNVTLINTDRDGFAHNPVINMKLQPDWSGYESVQNNSISFMIDGNTGVIKEELNAQTTRYFFVKNNQVWIYTCSHHGDGTVKDECDKILKSIRFT